MQRCVGECRLSQAQFVTYNPELQIFSSSIISFDFTDGGSILVRLSIMSLYLTPAQMFHLDAFNKAALTCPT